MSNGETTPLLAAALPRRAANPAAANAPPIWSLSAPDARPSSSGSPTDLVTPLPAKCAAHTDVREGVCCKTLKGDDERTLIDPDIVRDVVIGLSDGLTVPFALTAGLSSIGDSKLVVLGGAAELVAGAISMGIGGFLAAQSERDHYRYLRTQTRQRVARSCAGEMEREVHDVLGPVGVDEKLSRQVADCLMTVEASVVPEDEAYAGTRPSSVSWRGKQRTDSPARSDTENGSVDAARCADDVGLTAFLLKFGEGMEEVPTSRMYISAFTIGMGYFLGGLVPLVPYFFIPKAQTALIYSCLITGIILLIFGAVKTHVTGATGGARGYIWGAVSMLIVGGAAAGAAFGLVKAIEG
ncbi:hypothetical protein BOTBODRAFT_28709 [Botryobasidium botryosum FD-172 SS1]|uniref:Membrane fraction protein n=1 Tax=Botryobasidium botryosum (strain FD-172 SS1) TaxID=930990 RepID=A0A067MUC4_BOTB1|nr:hypothetical protein BOTBODRAFT_28709 [Botryobasidium botryosum FD-172 SS1]